MPHGRQESTSSTSPRGEGPSEEGGKNGVPDEERAAPVAPSRSRVVIPKPLLASEALKEDLAPSEPWGDGARGWMAATGAWFVLVGLAPFAGIPSDGGPSSLVIGGIVLAGGIVPISYFWRAILMLAAALAVGLLATVSTGPAWIAAVGHGAWAAVHLAAAIALPAALLFRARYRAYRPGRRMLMIAFVLSLPFVVHALLALGSGSLLVQIVTGVALAAIAGSLIGFTGSENSVAGASMAFTVIATVAAQLGVEALVSRTPHAQTLAGTLSASASAIAFACASLLGAFGCCMLLAGRHWRRARIVDIHRHVIDHGPPTLTDSWSTRK